MLCERCKTEIMSPKIDMPAQYFDRECRAVLIGHERRRLRPQEWNLLEILWRRRGSRVSIDAIMELLYRNRKDAAGDDAIVKTLVAHVRKALCGTPYAIDNEPKLGYRLSEEVPAAV